MVGIDKYDCILPSFVVPSIVGSSKRDCILLSLVCQKMDSHVGADAPERCSS